MVLLQVFASLDPNNEVSYWFSTFLPIVFVVLSSLDRPESLCPLQFLFLADLLSFCGGFCLLKLALRLSDFNLHFSGNHSGNCSYFRQSKGSQFDFPFLGYRSCWGFPHRPANSMAKGKKSKTQAAITSSTGKVATAAAATAAAATATAATAATAAAAVKVDTKAASFQAFISDLEASPSFPLSHASAGNGPNTLGRQEEEQPVGNGGKTEATITAKPSFAGLFSTNRKLTMENKLSKFHIEDGTITLESDDLTDVRAKLGFCTVGCIAGKFPGMQAIRALSKTWGASFQQHDSSWLVFRFARDDDRQRILARDQLWVEHPIAMDSLTMRMERVSYARILVEVDASKALVDHVEFKLPNGVTRRQSVVYEYTPKFCTECNRFGHHKSSCGDNQQPTTAAATATAAVGKSAANKQPTTKKVLPTEWTLVQRRQKTEHKQPQTAGTELKQKLSTKAAEQKQKQGMPVTEQGQQIVTDTNMADGAQERPESSKPQTSPKGQRKSNTLRQKEAAEVDSSASSCEPDSPASTQHLMPGTTAYRNLKMQHGGEFPPPHHHEDWILQCEGLQPAPQTQWGCPPHQE
ncbi:hypothetical protein Sango_2301700 [Sesamum angolense]|uniref:DUF4283 domain-containing protein n=1 Tax=Sesamum angolense TaxID=2727404 RepID=A0AAE1WA85_9LAMI|nr:hypothetical protein Sango_2301700 [Sesamum angolense]